MHVANKVNVLTRSLFEGDLGTTRKGKRYKATFPEFVQSVNLCLPSH